MEFSRRVFTKAGSTVLLFLALGVPSLTMFGCGVFSDILAWVPIGIAAINGIVSVLGPLVTPGASTIVGLVIALLNSLTGAIAAYNADTNPADKATALDKIRTILSDIVTNFQSFLDQLHIGTNPIETIIIGLANIFLAAIAGFLGQLPAPAGGAKTKTLTTSFKLGGKSMVIVPRYYKHASDFKSDWNRVCAADQHPEIELK